LCGFNLLVIELRNRCNNCSDKLLMLVFMMLVITDGF